LCYFMFLTVIKNSILITQVILKNL